jgi:hypothetical protein
MSILAIFQIIGLALNCIKGAEAAYQDAKSGVQKKEHAVAAFADGLEAAKAAGAPINHADVAQLNESGGDIIEAALDIAKQVGIIKPAAAGPDK